MKFFSYFKESYVELKKVVWPSWDSVKSNTLVVVVSVLSAAFILGFVDMFIVKILNFVIQF